STRCPVPARDLEVEMGRFAISKQCAAATRTSCTVTALSAGARSMEQRHSHSTNRATSVSADSKLLTGTASEAFHRDSAPAAKEAICDPRVESGAGFNLGARGEERNEAIRGIHGLRVMGVQ